MSAKRHAGVRDGPHGYSRLAFDHVRAIARQRDPQFPRAPVGNSLTKKQVFPHSDRVVAGRNARNASGTFTIEVIECQTGHDRIRESASPDLRNLPMRTTVNFGLAALLAAAVAGVGVAQQPNNTSTKSSGTTAASTDTTTKAAPQKVSLYRPLEIAHIRPADQRGVNVFESPKDDDVPFTGFALSFGGAFNQEFQGLDHSNSASPVMVSGVNQNQLITVGHGLTTPLPT
jgi:hypothetical protein